MRGRTLIQESTGPSVCAFCAHRLGQARRPSHVQRRFFQSSRPASRPPAEGAALKSNTEDSETRSAPSFGDLRGGNGDFGGCWGGGGIPQRISPARAWGGDGGGIPARPSQLETLSKPPIPDLDPHEQAARDLMLKKAAKAQQRTVNIPKGAGPQHTRAGRPVPPSRRTPEELVEEARRATDRLRARQAHDFTKQRGLVRRTGGFGHVIDDGLAPLAKNSPLAGDSLERSNWSQLKKKSQVEALKPIQEPVRRKEPFAKGRAQREEESKFARYTPLGSRSILDSINKDNPPWQTPSPQQVSRRGNDYSRSSENTFDGTRPSPFQLRNSSEWKVSGSSGDSGGYASEERFVPGACAQNDIHERPPRVTQNYSISELVQKEAKIKLQTKDQEEENERPSRQKKARKSRVSEEPTYSSLPKGKDRDKAKRRHQFGFDQDEEVTEREAARARAELKKQRKREKATKKPVPIILPEYISVSNLAVAVRVRFEEFVEKMTELGFTETGHDFILNAENASLIAMEYNFEPIIDRGDSDDLKAREPAVDPSILPSRPPVVTIMGHVDHGKTTILDYLRKSSVAATEHGGITQHIGAFSVPMPSGKLITFLDTPGHAAFLAMRQRGANVTDIVILVVAADDSVKPQTIEAINHAKAAKVPIIVAINKIDKPECDIDKVKQDLSRYGVDVEDFGGDTQVICVSGKTGQGMDELEEAAVALSDILDVRAERDGPAEGAIIEASIKSMGKVATVLVKRGTMRPGNFIVAGKTWARIRCLRNEAGIDIEEAGPGTPVEIDGWREQPEAGDEVLEAKTEQHAKSVVDFRLEKSERERLAQDMDAINESRKVEQEKREIERLEKLAEEEGSEFEMPEEKEGGPKQIYFVVKGDVSGSVEAVIDSVGVLGNKEVQPHILRSGVGQLSEFDIEHAAAAKGHVVNFNTEVEPHISRLAEQLKVNIINENIIYRLVDHVKAELSKYLPPLITQRVLGEAEIAQVFSITVKGRQQKNIAGCKVRNGSINKNLKVRVMRDGEKVFDGAVASLKNVKKDVLESKKGSECGMGFEDWFDFQVGDLIQSYDEKHEKRYL
ncbi:hypothetical protein BGZ60DRAFT_438596 [Tricladium varicosporioides]|nr:hypothetical protein BGZ60DRAFT_438596 [Hymenoscyphus varicosporioides]